MIPAFLHFQELCRPTLQSLKNSSSTIRKTAKNTACVHFTPATMPITLIILPTMCGRRARWQTRSPRFWPGYLHLSPRNGTRTFERVGWTEWEAGSPGPQNIRIGLIVFMGANLIIQPCFATGVMGLARPTLGKEEVVEGRKASLISCGVSSLVVDTLCKQGVGESVAVACFYFDFTAQEEQSAGAVLGSVLKQIVGGLDDIPERIVEAFRAREKVVGGPRLGLAEIVKLLQDISSSRSTFICIDALEECPSGHRMKLLDSLNQILQKSPRARIFLTGRPHIRGEVEKHLGRRAASISVGPTEGDIVIFLRAKLKEDTMLGAMNKSLGEEILRDIPPLVPKL